MNLIIYFKTFALRANSLRFVNTPDVRIVIADFHSLTLSFLKALTTYETKFLAILTAAIINHFFISFETN